MSQQPRFNEDRYYRYPKNRIAATLNDEQSLDEALKHLPQANVNVADVNVLSGSEGYACSTGAVFGGVSDPVYCVSRS
jgi:trans-aconitate methyltransferase